jgi:hypothetical protein
MPLLHGFFTLLRVADRCLKLQVKTQEDLA